MALREAERQRVLLIIEDLYWLDTSTLEFLNLLADQAATTHLFMTKGLEVLKTLPETLERRHQELTLQLALGAALSITEQAYNSARQLCQQVGDSPQCFAALAGLLWFIAAARSSRRHRNWGNSS